MKVLIIGGGIAGRYAANRIKEQASDTEVLILTNEPYHPYDRIHLARLVDGSATIKDISLSLVSGIDIRYRQNVRHIDPKTRKVITQSSAFDYDRVIIATGSTPRTLFDISHIKNAATFRSADDAKKIREGIGDKEVVIVGAGPIALELLDTLNGMKEVSRITLLVRSHTLYDKTLSPQSIQIIESAYLKSGKVRISYEDEMIDKTIFDDKITQIVTKKLKIDNPFLIFGIGIEPNIDFARETLECNRGILTNRKMQTSEKDIYAVGEAAEVRELGFIARHVKECTRQAEVAVANLLGIEERLFSLSVSIDMLKVAEFDLVDVISPEFRRQQAYEKLLMTSERNQRVDEYYIMQEKLIRFIGLNSNIDVGYIENLIQQQKPIDASCLYQNRKLSEKGRLICSCTHLYEKDLEALIREHSICSFQELGAYSQAGRVCGRCKKTVEDIIKASRPLIKSGKHKKQKSTEKVQKRLEKFNQLHPRNQLDQKDLESALDAFEIGAKELNSWVAMVTATMQLHPEFATFVKQGIHMLNKIPIIWLELADCSGNSEAFIKSAHPAIEDLIFEYISLDYHELLMSAAGAESESALEHTIKTEKGNYILIVEGAVPLGMEGKFLRIGTKGETGISLLRKCAKDAAMVVAVGSCAFDGGVVAAAPNPTGATGVAQALGREDIINLPGCPVNPINIVGTLLSYLMFDELPSLDRYNRPRWAYEGRIHDNCERRGHFELGEFVKEWGDEGAQKGWCLFEMGCKGPYANANCPTMKFNLNTSWPVQAGHGCMGCVEKGFFDKLANERKLTEEQS